MDGYEAVVIIAVCLTSVAITALMSYAGGC